VVSKPSESPLRDFIRRIDQAHKGLHTLPEIRVGQKGFLNQACKVEK